MTFRDDIIAFIKANVQRQPMDSNNACGKRQHLTADAAQKQIDDRNNREHKQLHNRHEVYECRKCGYFHIGHNPFKGRYKKFVNQPQKAKLHTPVS